MEGRRNRRKLVAVQYDDDSLDLYNEDWPILSKSPLESSHFLGAHCEISNSFVTEGCYIDGKVNHSIIFDGVSVEEGAEVVNSILMSGVTICKGAKIFNAIVAGNSIVGKNATIGLTDDETYLSHYCSGGVTLIGADVEIGGNVNIGKNNMVTGSVKEVK